jgi:hypothetical protein
LRRGLQLESRVYQLRADLVRSKDSEHTALIAVTHCQAERIAEGPSFGFGTLVLGIVIAVAIGAAGGIAAEAALHR